MARWKKISLGTTVLVAVSAIVMYFCRSALGALLVEATIGDFEANKAPPPPDYARESSWAALPDKDDASDRVPPGLVETSNPARDLVDVFYIHPTGFLKRTHWNASLEQEDDSDIPVSVMLAAQASAFNGCGRVFAPKYRQASIFAFLLPLLVPQQNDAYQALDLAYEDVARAFDYFIEHYSQGRPFIVASHSQGTHHALRLLWEKIDRTPLYSRLIAAYTIGLGVPKDYFERAFHNIVPCNSPTQTGCLITWDTSREGSWFHLPRVHRYPDKWEYAGGKPRFCINPLTWTESEERAPASLHLGALVAKMVPKKVNPDGCAFEGISPAHTWAQCHDGRLWIAEQAHGPFYDWFGVYHNYDINLFWMNLRENARARADTYLRAHGLPGRPRCVVSETASFSACLRSHIFTCLNPDPFLFSRLFSVSTCPLPSATRCCDATTYEHDLRLSSRFAHIPPRYQDNMCRGVSEAHRRRASAPKMPQIRLMSNRP